MTLTTETKVIIGIITAAVLGGFVWVYFSKKKEAAAAVAETAAVEAAAKRVNRRSNKFPLQFGSKGTEIVELQKAINILFLKNTTKLVEDGIFGSLTLAALKKYANKTQITETEYLAYKSQLT